MSSQCVCLRSEEAEEYKKVYVFTVTANHGPNFAAVARRVAKDLGGAQTMRSFARFRE